MGTKPWRVFTVALEMTSMIAFTAFMSTAITIYKFITTEKIFNCELNYFQYFRFTFKFWLLYHITFNLRLTVSELFI